MSNFKRFVYQLIGKLYIPEKLAEFKEKKLLHISDTPLGFYSELKRLIETVKPSYIVHTGDLVDNIKLQLYPTSIFDHEKGIKRLAAMFEASGAEIVLAIGNHDNFDIVSKHFKQSRIIVGADTILIEGMCFRISHFPEGIQENPARYNLYGHDLTLKTGCVDDKLYFNGISHINIIGLESGEYTSLDYPSGTDDERLGRHKIGL
jgi:predicted MPP superfamily phosphohydrolase